MIERQIRLKEVFSHLRNIGAVHTQKDLADAIGAQRPGISAALNGNPDYLTNSLFQKICDAFPVFDLHYLLTGEGQLLRQHVSIPRPQGEMNMTINEIEGTRNLLDVAAKIIKENEALHRQLQASIAELRSLIDRIGPIVEAERSSNFKNYPSMVADDSDFVEVK